MSFTFIAPHSLLYHDKRARRHAAWQRKTNRVQILQTNTEANDRWPESDSLNLLWRQSKVTCVYFEWAGDYTRIVYPKVGLHTSCCVSSLDQENEAPLEDNARQHFSFSAVEKGEARPHTREGLQSKTNPHTSISAWSLMCDCLSVCGLTAMKFCCSITVSVCDYTWMWQSLNSAI